MSAREYAERLAAEHGPITDEQVEAAARIFALVATEPREAS